VPGELRSATLCRSRLGLVTRWAGARLGEAGGVDPSGEPALLFVQQGVLRLGGHRQELSADPTQIVLLPAGLPPQPELRGREPGGHAAVVSLTSEGHRQVLKAAGRSAASLRSLFSHRAILRPPKVEQKLHVLLAAALRRETRPGLDLDARFLDLFLDVVSTAERARAMKGQWRPPAHRVRLALSRLLDESPSLQELASAAGCSRFHLCRVFKDEAGITINQYLHRLRLSQALPRLLAGEDDLSRLAHSLGYSSHSHFTSRFRRFFGVTPSAVREQAQLLGTASSADGFRSGEGAARALSPRTAAGSPRSGRGSRGRRG